jgi:hypothetical protein
VRKNFVKKPKPDPYTPFLPFDEPPATSPRQQELLLKRLGRYLAAGRPLPRSLPLLKLLPSLNNSRAGEDAQRFSEQEAAVLLTELGAELEVNPHYLGRSRYRITITPALAARALACHQQR